jgi:hypothetical protein
MPEFLLTFGDAGKRPVGAVIIEAPSMFQARMTAVSKQRSWSFGFSRIAATQAWLGQQSTNRS